MRKIAARAGLVIVMSCAMAAPAVARQVSLPAAAPRPQTRPLPEIETPAPQPLPETAPRHERRKPALPENMAAPAPRPDAPATETPAADRARENTAAGGDGTSKQAGNAGAPRRESVGRHNAASGGPRIDPALIRADEACRARLAELGAVFETRPPLSDPQGCSVPFPISVSKLASGIALEPPAVLNCPMAEAAARFAATTISPQAEAVYTTKLKAIANASAYVCRPRNGSTKLSEHAFGNALDMARFVLADGTAIDVAATDDARAKRFLDAVRKAACGPFKTVLGPGSDADHAHHFHFDLALRRGGATFCQ